MWWRLIEEDYSEYQIDYASWEGDHPPGISACFRVCNDAEFLEAAVLSHMPYVDEVVIALQPSSDGTEEIAYALADRYTKVNVYWYPVKPHFVDAAEFFQDPENSIHSFVYLSNWALSKCRYRWIAKTEADVICLSSFQKVVDRIRANPEKDCYYGRVILNVAGYQRDKISFENPRNGGWDEAVFPNKPHYHFVRRERWEQMIFPAPQECMGWSALHMKRCKAKYATGYNGEHLVTWDRENVRLALKRHNSHYPYPGPDDPLGEEVLYEPTLIGGAR